MSEKERPPTLGEYRVGISFNPGGNPTVDKIKGCAAEFIDLCEGLRQVNLTRTDDASEVLRLLALAMTHAEDAAMWAVKAVTKPPR